MDDERAVLALYRPLACCDWSRCYYCGDLKDTDDHVPSRWQVKANGIDWPARERIACVLVPVCTVCNSWVLNRKTIALHTLELRLLEVERVLRKSAGEYQTAQELADTFRRLAHCEQQLARRNWPVERAGGFWQRRAAVDVCGEVAANDRRA